MDQKQSQKFNPKPFKNIVCAIRDEKTLKKFQTNSFPLAIILNSFLYNKFASSQNYYFTKNINHILSNPGSHPAIMMKQIQNIDSKCESMTRFFPTSEQNTHLKALTEYYKYHREVPRLFMIPISEIIHEYHDRMRRINYIKVAKLIGLQEGEKVKLHDTDSFQDIDEGTFLNHYSILHIIPSELKQDRKMANSNSNQKQILNTNENSDSHLNLESFLNYVFPNDSKLSFFFNNKVENPKSQRKLDLHGKINPKLFEKLRLNLKKNQNSQLIQKFAENLQIKSLKVGFVDPEKGARNSIKLSYRNSVFQHFKKSHGVSKDSRGNNQTKVVLDNNARISTLQNSVKSQRLSDNHNAVLKDKRLTEKHIKNLNINNLNINIHMRSMKNELECKKKPHIPQKTQIKSKSVDVLTSKRPVSLTIIPNQSKKVNSSVISHLQSINNCQLETANQEGSKRDLASIFQHKKLTKSLEKTHILRLPSRNRVRLLNNQNLFQNQLFFKTSLETNLLKNFKTNPFAKKSIDKTPLKLKVSSNFALPNEKVCSINNISPTAQLLPYRIRQRSKNPVNKIDSSQKNMQKFDSFRSNNKNQVSTSVQKFCNPYLSKDNLTILKNFDGSIKTGSINLNLFHTLQTMINKNDISKKLSFIQTKNDVSTHLISKAKSSSKLIQKKYKPGVQPDKNKCLKVSKEGLFAVEGHCDDYSKKRKSSKNVFRSVFEEVLTKKKPN